MKLTQSCRLRDRTPSKSSAESPIPAVTLICQVKDAVKNRSWLSIAEYLMFLSSGVGSVAAVASQQVLYTAAPLSALLFLNLLNHRRLEQSAQEATDEAVSRVDKKLSGTIAALQQQVQAMPSPLHLASLRKDLQSRHQEAVGDLDRRLNQISQEVGRPEWRTLPNDVLHLQSQYKALVNAIASVREALSRLDSPTPNRPETLRQEMAAFKSELARLKTTLANLNQEQPAQSHRLLQDQINHLNRRLNKLPAPFDANFLKQDVESLIKVVGEMAGRRDLARLEAQIEKLSKQNETLEQAVGSQKTVSTILKKEMATVASKIGIVENMLSLSSGALSRPSGLEALTATVNNLEQRVNQLPGTDDLNHLRTELQGLVTHHAEQLQQQFEVVQQHTQELGQQHQALREWVHRLPQILDSSALHTEVKYLATRVEWAESSLTELQSQVGPRQADLPSFELIFEMQPGTPINASTAETVDISVQKSRSLLAGALDTAQARLVMVCPFPDPAVLDDAMIEHFQAFLNRKGCLDIGWGHLTERSDRVEPRSIDRRRGITPSKDHFLFHTLNQLTELKRQYPNQFRFKVMGTDEYFLVCDRTYAVLGAQSVATASVLFPKAAVGLRTSDPTVIQQLVARFDDPVLDAQDGAAYFNRAATRYELGDRQGAIADYTEVLRINPNDDVAYNNRGLARYDLGEKGAAIADFEDALQRNAQNYIASFNRGYIRAEQGDKLGAIEDYTYAIQCNPDYAPAYFYRGLARTRMQNKLGAIQDYTEVIRLHPDDAGAYFYRGLASAKIGQRMEAIRDLRQAAQLFEAQEDKANYQQTITALKKLQKTMVIGGLGKPLLSNEA